MSLLDAFEISEDYVRDEAMREIKSGKEISILTELVKEQILNMVGDLRDIDSSTAQEHFGGACQLVAEAIAKKIHDDEFSEGEAE